MSPDKIGTKIELYLLAIDGEGFAMIMGKSEDHAVQVFRQNTLGQNIQGVVTAQRAADAPFEMFTRTALIGLYSRLFQADLAQAMAARGGP